MRYAPEFAISLFREDGGALQSKECPHCKQTMKVIKTSIYLERRLNSIRKLYFAIDQERFVLKFSSCPPSNKRSMIFPAEF